LNGLQVVIFQKNSSKTIAGIFLPAYYKIKNPDTRKNPKTWLTQLFNKEIGGRCKYNDVSDVEQIVKGFEDFKRLKNSDSFIRFAQKTTGKTDLS